MPTIPNIIKLFQIIKKLLSAQEFGLEICSGETTREKNIALLLCDILS